MSKVNNFQSNTEESNTFLITVAAIAVLALFGFIGFALMVYGLASLQHKRWLNELSHFSILAIHKAEKGQREKQANRLR